LFRKFPKGKTPEIYYQYIREEVGRDEISGYVNIKNSAKEASV
jgi:DNA (cytosine-5)-methyltransferase 1